MRNIINATLAFGPIYVPVGVATSAKRGEMKFRQLHVDCGRPLSKVMVCKECDMSRSLPEEEIVKGYEITKNNFVLVDEEEISSLVAPKSSLIELTKFVDTLEVSPMLVEKTYFLNPNASLYKPYEILSTALIEAGMAGIGKATLWKKEYPVAVVASAGVLTLKILFCADEVVSADEIRAGLRWDVTDEEKDLTIQFLETRRGGIEVEDLTNDSRIKTLHYIEAKAQGALFTKPEPEPAPFPTIDYVAVMKEAVASRSK